MAVPDNSAVEFVLYKPGKISREISCFLEEFASSTLTRKAHSQVITPAQTMALYNVYAFDWSA
jgi:hypothetical protein